MTELVAKMDPSEASELFHQTSALLCLDVPQGCEFGIDNHSWEVGPKFKGVKLIPPGVHYIFYSMKNKYGGSSAPRTSFFIRCKPGQVIVRRWDSESEDLIELQDKDEEERFALGVRRFEFDSFLGAFPWNDPKSMEKWQSLSNHISGSVLRRLEPAGRKITSAAKPLTKSEISYLETAFKSLSKEEIENSLESSSNIFYTKIPRHFAPASRDLADVTRFNLDKSKLLDHILVQNKFVDSHGKPKPQILLGEMQFAFLSFLMGHTFDSFEQWKTILGLMCSCESALKTNPTFFKQYIRALQSQLGEIPEDFFVDTLSGKNFLTSTLTGFFELLDDDTLEASLLDAAQDLRKFVERRFGRSFSVLDLDDIDDDDAPTIVDL